MTSTARARPRVAFFDFTCCEGCQLTVIDSLENHPELLEVIEIVEFREASSDQATSYDIAFIEGSCTRPSDEDRLRLIRQRAKLVVALGSCADLGGINAIRNGRPTIEAARVVYPGHEEQFESYEVHAISSIIQVDCTVPGCPITQEEFLDTVRHLLQGRIPSVKDYPVCIECKLRETSCVYGHGEICLGPVVRAGCQAVCPARGHHCVGCRGLTSNANLESLRTVLEDHGLSSADIEASLSMFLNLQIPRHNPENGDG